MKLKSLLSKFQPKKRNKNVLKGDKKNISSNSSSKKEQKRRSKRNIVNVGSPSSSLITQKTDSYCDDDGSDGIYHPEYIPPSPKVFAPTTINSPLNYEQGQVGETDLSRPSEQTLALNENLYSQDVVVVRENERDSRQGSPQIEKKRFVHNGVTSQMVWMKSTLLDDISEDEGNYEDENIHSSEYLSATVDGENDDSKCRDDLAALNRPMTLTSLALDSTRASSMYRTYESDFDDYGLVTGVAVIDGIRSEEDNIVGDLSYHQTSQQQSDDIVDDDPPLLPLDKSDDDESDSDDYSIPEGEMGISPIRWPSQATDMAGPAPPEPEPDFPMDELYDDLRVLILDDDVSALSSDTPPPTVYRNMQQELRRRPSVNSSKFKPPATTSSWTCHPSFLRRSSLQKIAEDDDDKELPVASMFCKVFHCDNSPETKSSSPFPAGTTITVSATRSGSRSNSHPPVRPPVRYESIDECVEA
ncbi:MAG: hypothetical protein SGBAC_008333 [Bacillariaceae sp.]